MQAQELLTTDAYQRGDTKQALVDAFLKMDQLLLQESVVPELQSLAGPRNLDEEDEYVPLLSDSFAFTAPFGWHAFSLLVRMKL